MKKFSIIGLPQVGLPLLIVKAQAKNLCFLLDTGSNINVLDRRVAECFQLSGGTAKQRQFGIDGEQQMLLNWLFLWKSRNTKLISQSWTCPQLLEKWKKNRAYRFMAFWDALSWNSKNGFSILKDYACTLLSI